MTKNNRLNFKQMAPDLTLLDIHSKPVKLSGLWAKKPLLLGFTHHFGCTQCKEMLNKIISGRERIEKAGLGIALIMQGTPEGTVEFSREFAPGLLCRVDPRAETSWDHGGPRRGCASMSIVCF